MYGHHKLIGLETHENTFFIYDIEESLLADHLKELIQIELGQRNFLLSIT